MFGPHVNRYHAEGSSATLAEHIEAACAEAALSADFKVGAVSVFVSSPRKLHLALAKGEAAGLRRHVDKTGLCVIAHSSYAASPWGGDAEAARHIRAESRACAEAGISGLVVHLPKAPPSAVAPHLLSLVERGGVRIYLETPAVTQPASYYETPEKLADLFGLIRERVDPEGSLFGLCVDTAHLWVSGVDLRSYEAADAWLRALELRLPDTPVVVHLNDSAREMGKGPDAHAGLGRGKIWGAYQGRAGASGIAAVADYARRHNAPVILERKPKEALVADYHVLREWLPR